MSDLHVDFKYLLGSNTNCGLVTCCQADKGIPLNESYEAGLYGDYNCNTPAITLETMLQYIRDEIKPDIIFWTGDSIPYNYWQHSK
jgi:hypothetical protein